ncbi:unnamed protein product [Blepharisma stoltei]|uniref:Uncharacterized protein n=1 Tax=Blepharisma stoltei TaxID=1481888 RepID=A0AAU9JSB7_9CILI|nr:unnamed protein product [Blepharisma stoltei]
MDFCNEEPALNPGKTWPLQLIENVAFSIFRPDELIELEPCRSSGWGSVSRGFLCNPDNKVELSWILI